MAIVPVTAMPYAAASFTDSRNVKHQRQTADGQHRVDFRNVDLPLGVIGGVLDRHPRQVAQNHRLPRERKRPRNQCLRRDHRRGARQHDQQIRRQSRRHHRIERVLDGLRIAEDERPCPR